MPLHPQEHTLARFSSPSKSAVLWTTARLLHNTATRVLAVRQPLSSRSLAAGLVGAKPAAAPAFIAPALATLRSTVPAGARFVHELKLEGYRVQAHLREGRVMRRVVASAAVEGPLSG
jgi:bifunctional non-homologous end joining protein LigD